MEIKGTKALVTGASSGIGKALAERLASGGSQVWGTSRNPRAIEWPVGITPLELDLGSSESIEAAWNSQSMDALKFDIVVNNAGFGFFGRFSNAEFDDIEALLDALLIGTMKLCRLAVPGLIERRGYLVNVSSMATDFPVPFMSAYNAAKAGLSGFTESVVIETSASGMKTIDFRPGDICTAFNSNMIRKNSKIPNEGCMDRVWKRIEERISKSPDPEVAADKLARCISKDRTGTIRTGTFFQSKLAPLLARLAPNSLVRSGNLAYYTK